MSSLAISKVLSKLETSSSIGLFARDTGGCLLSRLGLSRSEDESREIAIAELSESALFYFSAPILAKALGAVFSGAIGINRKTFSKSIQDLWVELKPEMYKKAKIAKFAQVGLVFSLILPAIYAIAPIRNLVTLDKTGKNKFTSVVGLDKSKQNKQKPANDNSLSGETKEKAVDLAKKLAKIAGISAASIMGLCAIGSTNIGYKILSPVFDKILKLFDFTDKCDLKLMHYGALIYPVSILSYFQSSRDKYEVKENARRFSVTVPLLFFGDKLIQNPIHRYFDKKFSTNIIDDMNNIMTYNDIKKLPDNIKNQALKSKNAAFASTFAISTLMVAAGVALLNRVKTRTDYKKDTDKTKGYQNGIH